MTSENNSIDPKPPTLSSPLVSEWLSSQSETDAGDSLSDAAFSSQAMEPEESIDGLNASQMSAVLHFDEDQGDYGETGADVATGVSASALEDPHQATTKRPFHRQGPAKLALIASGTLLAVLVVSSMFGSIFSSGSRQVAQTPDPETADATDGQTEAGQPNAEVLTALALSEQDQQLQALKKGKAAPEPPKTETAAKPPEPQKAEAPAPTAQPRPTGGRRAPARRTSARRTAFRSPPRRASRPGFLQSPRQAAPTPPRPSAPVAQPQQPAPATLDPGAAWLAAAQAGSFGQGAASNQGPSQPSFAPASGNNVQFVRNSGRRSFPSVNRPSSAPSHAPNWPSINSDDESLILATGQSRSLKSLRVGTSVRATLVTPIAWETSAAASGPKQYLIALKDGLEAMDGSVVLPKGTQLVAQQSSFSSNGLVDLNLVAAMVEVDGQYREVKLPQGALQVNGKGGKPLFAKSRGGKRSGGGILGTLGQVGLGSLRQASEIFNRSDTVFSSSGSGTFVSNSNSSPNVLAGVVQGGTDSLLRDLQTRGRRSLSGSTGARQPIWYAKAGTQLEIYVNQSVSIPGIGFQTQIATTQLSPSSFQSSLAEQPVGGPAFSAAPDEVELQLPPQPGQFAQQPLNLALEVQDNMHSIVPSAPVNANSAGF